MTSARTTEDLGEQRKARARLSYAAKRARENLQRMRARMTEQMDLPCDPSYRGLLSPEVRARFEVWKQTTKYDPPVATNGKPL